MKLLFRTDASTSIGTGHVMRCLALAQAWQDAGGSATFAMAETTPAIQARLGAESFEVLSVSSLSGTADDARETVALARERQAGWIAVDGYQFSADYQRDLKAAGFKLLFLDDYGHAEHYSADLVLNQNASANEALHAKREAHTRLLLGPRYCLLRREFAPWRDWTREVPSVGRRVLVMMGGSDPDNLTARVLDALQLVNLPDLEATVMVGGSNPHAVVLEKTVAKTGLKIAIKRDVANVAELMAAADVAVSAAGSTCWEICLMGLPALLLAVAHNQTAVAEELNRRGCAIHVGDPTASVDWIAQQLERLLRSSELRQSLSQRSRELVDGKGASRVISVLRGSAGLRLRRARAEDSRLLWEWANDPEARAAAFSSDPIPWETHVAWFAKKLGQPSSLILVAEDDEGSPYGEVRFDARPDGDWEVDVIVAKTMRGRGLAGGLLRLGMQAIGEKHPSVRVHAFVKPANVASVKMCENAGFRQTGTEQVRGSVVIHLICERE